jgi:hypothetical protein
MRPRDSGMARGDESRCVDLLSFGFRFRFHARLSGRITGALETAPPYAHQTSVHPAYDARIEAAPQQR